MTAGRVLQLLGPSTGGLRAHAVALTAALRQRGWDVTVAGPAGVVDGLDAVVDVAGPRRVDRLWRARRQLTSLLDEGRFDVVHAHGLKAGWLAALVRPRPRRLVVTVHNVVLPETVGRAAPVLRRAEAALGSRADVLLATSAGVAGRFATPNVRVVPPFGADPVVTRSAATVRRDLGLDASAPVVVSVARLHPQKGLVTLIDAAARLRQSIPDVVVAIAGEGPEEPLLRERIDAAGLRGVVRLLGPVAPAADLLAAADVVAVSSVWESGPLVAAEALTLGRPLVSTPVGFVPDLVADGVSGRLVPVGDAAAMAWALADVLADPTAAARMGAAGRHRVAQVLDRDRLVDAVEAAYRGVPARPAEAEAER